MKASELALMLNGSQGEQGECALCFPTLGNRFRSRIITLRVNNECPNLYCAELSNSTLLKDGAHCTTSSTTFI